MLLFVNKKMSDHKNGFTHILISSGGWKIHCKCPFNDRIFNGKNNNNNKEQEKKIVVTRPPSCRVWNKNIHLVASSAINSDKKNKARAAYSKLINGNENESHFSVVILTHNFSLKNV